MEIPYEYDKIQPYIASILPDIKRYIQPPEGINMTYPCVVIEVYGMQIKKADNTLYNMKYRYMIKYISLKPDNEVITKILTIPSCRFVRTQCIDKLYHTVFEIIF